MIVVDTNILAYLYLPTEHTHKVEALLAKDPEWIAPILWRSEFRNVLALYLRKNLLTLEQALEIQNEAEALLQDNEFIVTSLDVLQLVKNSECSAYDCEFVALAQSMNVQLITMDKRVLKNFPETAISLA
ncbi:MAG: type II toxin-antitoxin system VapC family toxin [Desulfuromonadales bacterium]|nr:type II toxin-antitoxin system VapC family toxin [Desulfuromonadales bacterium]